MCDDRSILTNTAEREPAVFDPAELRAFVDGFLQRRDEFLQASRRQGSPLYVLEEALLHARARQFTEAFTAALPDVRVYYAMKSNNCPQVVRTLLKTGLGLDVSSGLELQAALDCGAPDIVFSGPGKTESELAQAVENAKSTTVLIDSFGELQRLQRVAAEKGARVRAGVRLTTDNRGLWRKFGIPLADLPQFLNAARSCDRVNVRGLQFHTSWNLDPDNQVAFIARLGDAVGELQADQQAMIEFIDVGGGYWPSQGEWLQSPGPAEGDSRQTPAQQEAPGLRHYKRCARPIAEFADRLVRAMQTYVFPHVSCRICAEPGRWLCNDAVHLLLTVVDRKADDLVITDAGTNAVGWERFEKDYFPVINLSRPSLLERECHVLGSLCTPHDVWGYSYWGADIQPGDVLLIPTQGAYTYSLRQEFIKPLPSLAILDSSDHP